MATAAKKITKIAGKMILKAMREIQKAARGSVTIRRITGPDGRVSQ
jgi:hypothetical protein